MGTSDNAAPESSRHPTTGDQGEARLRDALRTLGGEVAGVLPAPLSGSTGAELLAALLGALRAPDLQTRTAAAVLVAEGAPWLKGLMCARSMVSGEEPESLVRGMCSALRDSDPRVRVHLLEALQSILNRDLAAPIVAAVQQHTLADSNPEVATRSLSVLVAAGVDAASVAVREVTTLLRHQDRQVRRAACELLKDFEVEARCALSHLAELATEPGDTDLQRHAARALVKIDPSGERLQHLVQQPEQEIVLAILRDLGEEGRPLRRALQARWDPNEAATHHIPPELLGVWHVFPTKKRKLLEVLWRNRQPEGLPIEGVFPHMGWERSFDPNKNFSTHLSQIRRQLKSLGREVPFCIKGHRVFWQKP